MELTNPYHTVSTLGISKATEHYDCLLIIGNISEFKVANLFDVNSGFFIGLSFEKKRCLVAYWTNWKINNLRVSLWLLNLPIS